MEQAAKTSILKGTLLNVSPEINVSPLWLQSAVKTSYFGPEIRVSAPPAFACSLCDSLYTPVCFPSPADKYLQATLLAFFGPKLTMILARYLSKLQLMFSISSLLGYTVSWA